MVLFNPISGPGRANVTAERLAQHARGAGHHVLVQPTSLALSESWLDPELSEVDALIVAGGDGTVRMAAPSAIRTRVPLYHLALGTENLFAREFGMNNSPSTVLGALERFNVRNVDVAAANGHTFLLMASVGYDAEVVHDLALCRGPSISHFSYLPPVLRQLWRWKPPHLIIVVDGQRIEDDGPGFVVVANSKQYGWRLNPAARASMDDGLLDVAYFPACSRLELLSWAVRCRFQKHLGHCRFIYRSGRSVTIASPAPQRYQLDGDPMGAMLEESSTNAGQSDRGEPFSLRIEVQPAVLPVLVP